MPKLIAPNPAPEPGNFSSAIVMAGVLLIVALALALGPWDFSSPVTATIPVPPRMIDPTPVRQPSFGPIAVVAGKTYRCSDCHKNFLSPATQPARTLTQHMGIVLRHGLNDRCFNCHNINNRDVFAGDWGEEIPEDQPQRLCGKCHGPVYRDWLNGAHGRTNGYWDTSKGLQTRRKCIECHDPHAPAFAPLQPAPGPNTLRMGDQHLQPDVETVPNPLHVFRQDLPQAGGDK